MRNKRNKGFTLVELLIVIVIIGILAGAMMMLMGSSSDKAEATKVISDLRTMKGAMLQYYTDHSEYPPTGDVAALEAYIDKDLVDTDYDLQNDAANNAVFVGRIIPSAGAGEKFRDSVVNDNMEAWFLAAKGIPTSGDLITSTSDIQEDNWVYFKGN